jgi:NADPH-dependent curcumin reductase CurA
MGRRPRRTDQRWLRELLDGLDFGAVDLPPRPPRRRRALRALGPAAWTAFASAGWLAMLAPTAGAVALVVATAGAYVALARVAGPPPAAYLSRP